MYQRLGRGNREPLPSCVVRAIRRHYPDPSSRYTGFRDAEEGCPEGVDDADIGNGGGDVDGDNDDDEDDDDYDYDYDYVDDSNY